MTDNKNITYPQILQICDVSIRFAECLSILRNRDKILLNGVLKNTLQLLLWSQQNFSPEIIEKHQVAKQEQEKKLMFFGEENRDWLNLDLSPDEMLKTEKGQACPFQPIQFRGLNSCLDHPSLFNEMSVLKLMSFSMTVLCMMKNQFDQHEGKIAKREGTRLLKLAEGVRKIAENKKSKEVTEYRVLSVFEEDYKKKILENSCDLYCKENDRLGLFKNITTQEKFEDMVWQDLKESYQTLHDFIKDDQETVDDCDALGVVLGKYRVNKEMCDRRYKLLYHECHRKLNKQDELDIEKLPSLDKLGLL